MYDGRCYLCRGPYVGYGEKCPKCGAVQPEPPRKVMEDEYLKGIGARKSVAERVAEKEFIPVTPVKGYTQQTAEALSLVNGNKELEERVLRVIDSILANPKCDPRWASIARTHIEEGFMAMNRAVFKPKRIRLGDETDIPEDHR